MASSASAPSPNPPLSPQENDDNEIHHTHGDPRRRTGKVDRNSSPPLRRKPQETTSHLWRRSKNSERNHRTLPDSRISNHNSTCSSSSSSEDEEERRRQRQKRSLSRLRKTNRITSGGGGTFTSSSSSTSTTRNKKSPALPLPKILSPPPSSSPLYPHADLQREGLRISFYENYNFPFIPSYTLQWKEQKTSIQSEISAFFQTQKFVDVTLIPDSEDGSSNRGIPAHKIILATSSEYFRRLLEENPCKHPVILLKGFSRWDVETLLEFMYQGEVKIDTAEQVESLLRAADVLQIRGLRECLAAKSSGSGRGMFETQVVGTQPQVPATCHNNEDVKGDKEGSESPKLLNLSLSGRRRGGDGPLPGDEGRGNPGRNGPQTTSTAHQPGFSIPHHHHHHPLDQQQGNSASSPPFPRRKQARPRRRSGDFIAQDLRIVGPTIMSPTVVPPDSPDAGQLYPKVKMEPKNNGMLGDDEEETVLDFTINHSRLPQLDTFREGVDQERFLEGVGQEMTSDFSPTAKGWHFQGLESLTPPPNRHRSEGESRAGPPPVDPGCQSPPEERHSQMDKFRRSRREGSFLMDSMHFNGNNGGGMVFKGSPPTPPHFLLNCNGYPQPPSDSESNNPETPPTVFSPSGFPPPAGKKRNSGGRGGDSHGGQKSQPWPGLPIGPPPIFGRHRAQHSAPRGGPPRAWSNADLTEALHNVWNKKLSTSQASRMFGIPYNSLLMYVRGKYGKSLKLDLLKKGLDMAMESNAAAAAAAKGSGVNKSKAPPSSGRGSPRSPRSSPSSNNATPPHNNNNNNTIPSKGSGGKCQGGSPLGSPPSLSLTTLLSQGLGGGGAQSPESLRMALHHKNSEGGTPMGEMLPPPFNPFSMGSIFGDYPPPFPFPTMAAANAALSQILPPRPHHLLTSSHRRIPHHNGPTDK